MAKHIQVSLSDEQQAVLEEINRLHAQALRGDAPTERTIIAAAVNTGLRRDLATMRRVVGLQERYAK